MLRSIPDPVDVRSDLRNRWGAISKFVGLDLPAIIPMRLVETRDRRSQSEQS